MSSRLFDISEHMNRHDQYFVR